MPLELGTEVSKQLFSEKHQESPGFQAKLWAKIQKRGRKKKRESHVF